jgi:hypothetical protein
MTFSSVFRCFCKCFRYMFQVFHCFQMYVANVSFECFKSRSDVAYVAMDPPAAATYCNCMSNGEGASGPRTRSGSVGSVWAARAPRGYVKTQEWGTGVLVLARSAGARGKWSVEVDVRKSGR